MKELETVGRLTCIRRIKMPDWTADRPGSSGWLCRCSCGNWHLARDAKLNHARKRGYDVGCCSCSIERARKTQAEGFSNETCGFCGAVFKKIRAHQRFCSAACRYRVEHAKDQKKRNKPKRKVICGFCGRDFTTSRTNQICCSYRCIQKLSYRRKALAKLQRGLEDFAAFANKER